MKTKNLLKLKRYTRIAFLIFFQISCLQLYGLQHEGSVLEQEKVTKVKGIVFHDKNGNGFFDPGKDTPLAGIAVSNGREIAISNKNGSYELPLEENSIIFVIKPRNWMTPVGKDQLPRFYYVHSPAGITETRFKGLPPTGPLPKSVNFPLYPVKEPDKYDVLVFGDTQARNSNEVNYITHDVIPELIGTNASFGVTLGDIVFNNLDFFDHLITMKSTIGIPWRNVLGNHDIDFANTKNNLDARGAWYRTYGPSYYSFSLGPAHYIVLDNIRFVNEEKNYYKTGLGTAQMEFLKNELSRLDKNQLLVLMTHIPWAGSTVWEDDAERRMLYELLAGFENSVTLVAHTHRHYHHFIGAEDGFPGNKPHHMISVGTVCGSWWAGAPDEYGIPHALMSDGTPTSYAFLQIDGNDWKLRWKAARRAADFQMHIHAPNEIGSSESSNLKVTANIFNALPSAQVRMKIGDDGEWIDMQRTRQFDPVRVAVFEREKELGEVPWRSLGNPAVSEHLWVAEPGVKLGSGAYVIHVQSSDEWWEYKGKRILYVK